MPRVIHTKAISHIEQSAATPLHQSGWQQYFTQKLLNHSVRATPVTKYSIIPQLQTIALDPSGEFEHIHCADSSTHEWDSRLTPTNAEFFLSWRRRRCPERSSRQDDQGRWLGKQREREREERGAPNEVAEMEGKQSCSYGRELKFLLGDNFCCSAVHCQVSGRSQVDKTYA